MLIVRPALRLISGTGSLERLSAELARLGASRPMLLHTRSLEGSELIGQVNGLIHPTATFDGVRAHTPLPSVLAAAELAQQAGADCLVGVGGGSVAVTARATAIVVGEGSNVASLATRRSADGRAVSPKLTRAKLPIILIATTPSTAHAKAGTAVTVPGHASRLYARRTLASGRFRLPRRERDCAAR